MPATARPFACIRKPTGLDSLASRSGSEANSMNARLNDRDAPFGESHGPLLTGAFAPVFEELVLDALPVDGEIPADLNGVYLRNGPNPRFEPNGTYHPFDGDGMIHAAHFDRGRVTYRNRWVRTDALAEEERAGASPFWGIMSTLKGRSDRRLKDTANTDVIAHGGRAVASWYLAGTPYLVDPITLETVGQARYTRAPGNGFSAHPKVDELTGELLFFSYSKQAPYMSYGVVDPSGQVVHKVAIPLPGPRLPHDMAFTERYAILNDCPVFWDPALLARNIHRARFYRELPTRFAIIPRRGSSEEIRWFEASPTYVLHWTNAYEEGDEIVLEGFHQGCPLSEHRSGDGPWSAMMRGVDLWELKARAHR